MIFACKSWKWCYIMITTSENEDFRSFKSGCGSVWLERCVRDAEAGGSNPLTPTIFFAKKWSTKPSGFTSCGDSRSSLKKRSFFFTSSPVLNSALKWTTHWTTPQGKCVLWQQKSRISSSVMASITSGVVFPQFWPTVVPVRWKYPLKQAIWLLTSLKW